MMSSVISSAYFTHFPTEISPELMQIFANGKWRVHSYMDLYVIRSKNQEVKI